MDSRFILLGGGGLLGEAKWTLGQQEAGIPGKGLLFTSTLDPIMYSFSGNLQARDRLFLDRFTRKLLERRAARLERWYRYINRNRRLGKVLSFLFGALELLLMESVRLVASVIPSAHSRFMRLLDGKWGSKIIPLNVEINEVTTAVLPHHQILEIARRAPIRSLNWCYCYRTRGDWKPGQPDRYSCLALGWGQNLREIDSLKAHDPGEPIGKNLTYSELENKLKEWNAKGYVHQVIFFPSPEYFYIICNCHPDFCLTLSNLKKWGYPAVVKSDFIASWDESTCTGCMTCVGRCHFGAFTGDGASGKPRFNPGRCMGCGLCVSTCVPGALTLVPRRGRG